MCESVTVYRNSKLVVCYVCNKFKTEEKRGVGGVVIVDFQRDKEIWRKQIYFM